MAELLVYGLFLGSIIALSSIGLTLIWGVTDLFNCAHGDQITVGAYLALAFSAIFANLNIFQGKVGPFSFTWGLLISFIPAIIFSILLAILLEIIIYRPIRRSGAHSMSGFVASIGVAFALRGLIYVFAGPDFHFFIDGLRDVIKIPLGEPVAHIVETGETIIKQDIIKLKVDEIFIMIVAWVCVALVYLFMSKTKMGKALRALADNPNLARVTGINTDRMVMWAWGIAATLIAISGILFGIETQLRPEMGWIFLLPLFAAIILGGKGSITGALAGGMVLGVAQQMSTLWIKPTYKPAVAFIIMILVLLFRPSGIFGRRK